MFSRKIGADVVPAATQAQADKTARTPAQLLDYVRTKLAQADKAKRPPPSLINKALPDAGSGPPSYASRQTTPPGSPQVAPAPAYYAKPPMPVAMPVPVPVPVYTLVPLPPGMDFRTPPSSSAARMFADPIWSRQPKLALDPGAPAPSASASRLPLGGPIWPHHASLPPPPSPTSPRPSDVATIVPPPVPRLARATPSTPPVIPPRTSSLPTVQPGQPARGTMRQFAQWLRPRR